MTLNTISTMSDKNSEWLAALFQEGIYVVPEEKPAADNKIIQEKNDTEPKVPEETSDDILPMPGFRGKNKKHILVLAARELTPAEDEFLTKIMNAAGLSWDDIAFINWKEQPRPDLLDRLETHVVISFGLEHDPWCDAVPYSVHHANGVTHLRADDLQSLNENTDLKRKLWMALKEMFGV